MDEERNYKEEKLNKLQNKINNLRYQLLEKASKEGLESPVVLNISQELDVYIVKYQRVRSSINKSK